MGQHNTAQPSAHRLALSAQQQAALDKIRDRLARREPVTKIDGPAGTGKTTIARELRGSGVLYVAYTGKAAHVLRTKGCTPVSTLHNLIMRWDHDEIDSRGKKQPHYVVNQQSEAQGATTLVADEHSMIDRQIGEALLSFGIPIVLFGDSAQLPPVRGTGYFVNNFPTDIRLAEIHRQAANSPVLKHATQVRTGGPVIHKRIHKSRARAHDVVIVGLNKTRWHWNNYLRGLRNLDGPPQIGDRVSCRENNLNYGLFNGQEFDVLEYVRRDERIGHIRVRDEIGEEATYSVWAQPFDGLKAERLLEDGMDYGPRQQHAYMSFANAITCHKAQGSEWDSVLIYDESDHPQFLDLKREWLYTAITRARTKVTVVRPGSLR